MKVPYPTPEEVWRDYVHGEAPREFIARLACSSADACVAAHLDMLPDVYGIVRVGSWGNSFSQPWQLRRPEVAQAMLAYLNAHEETWWDALRAEERAPQVAEEQVITAEADPVSPSVAEQPLENEMSEAEAPDNVMEDEPAA